jgi:hypothetical protein
MGYNGNTTTKKEIIMEKLAFDIQVFDGYSQPNRHFSFEITEDYEGDKWHIVIFEKVNDKSPYEHIDTVGVNTEKEVFDLIRQYHEGKK